MTSSIAARFTIRRLLGIVAAVAVGLLAFREDGGPILGALLVIGAIAGIAWIGTRGRLRSRSRDGLPFAPRDARIAVARSLAVAIALVAICDLAFIFLWEMMEPTFIYHLAVRYRPAAAFIAGAATLGLAIGLRWFFFPDERKPTTARRRIEAARSLVIALVIEAAILLMIALVLAWFVGLWLAWFVGLWLGRFG